MSENETDNNETERYRIMVVDDSAFIRGAIARAIEADPLFEIVSSVSNGEQAVKTLQRAPVDVIVLDIEMPVMDGLTALPLLKEIDPAVQVIMASTLTQKNAEISLKAMSLGATDYIPKPSSGHAVIGALDFQQELVLKLKALGGLARRMGVRKTIIKSSLIPSIQRSAPVVPLKDKPHHGAPSGDKEPQSLKERIEARQARAAEERTPIQVVPQKKEVVLRTDTIFRPEVIAIGSSTGGPQALFRVIKDMGADLHQPIV
ncbi:MAG: response regulator, partial [Bdellovibrionales bacterium]